MNEQDESEVLMDTLAGESSLKKILEMLEDLSRRMANIETTISMQNNSYKWTQTYGTTTPYVTIDNQTHSGTTNHTYTSDGNTYTYYTENTNKLA